MNWVSLRATKPPARTVTPGRNAPTREAAPAAAPPGEEARPESSRPGRERLLKAVAALKLTMLLHSEAAAELYRACRAAGLDALLDDRDERPGVKFKDADLIGVPYRITIGKKLAHGTVEVVDRRNKQSTDVPVGEAAEFVAQKYSAALRR